jgi:hypothetical protein
MAVLIPNISAAEILDRFRGQVVSSKPGYPEVLLLTVKDAQGGEWDFCTFDADFTPADPDVFFDKVIVDAEVETSNDLTISFADETELRVVPRPLEPGEEDDDLENWYILTPDYRTLNFGPVGRWRLGRGDEPW